MKKQDLLVPQIESNLNSIAGSEAPAPGALGEQIDAVLRFLRRRYLVILIPLLLSLPAGAAYLFMTPATYTASAVMMIETRKNQLAGALFGEVAPDAGWIESQIGALKSLNVAAYVVKQLRLADDPAFIGEQPGLLDKLFARVGWTAPEPKTEAERVGKATSVLLNGLKIRRLGVSYMIEINFTSTDSEKAVKVANAMVDGYIFDQLNAKYQANRRAGDWLQERLQALREQTAVAERAVIDFKAKNNIVASGGTLMNDKQLGDVAGQLAAARAHASDVEARLKRISAVRPSYRQEQAGSEPDEIVSEAMSNGIINKLQSQNLDLANRAADWAAKYGKDHIAVVNLRNQIRDVRKSIYDELGRIEETFKSEYEIAAKRRDELEKTLAGLISQSQQTNQAQVTLFSLEAGAKSYRKLYDSFLQQYTESQQQQSYPISDARTLSPASVIQSGPRGSIVWLVTILAGGMLGVGFAGLQEILDRGFRTREQIRSFLRPIVLR